MLKAVKECMKNWLVTHERLYWYIVVGLAVLAFGIITALGCAKLEKAEAAVRSDFENMLTEQLRSYRNEDKPMYAYLGFEFWEDGAESPYKTLMLLEGNSDTVFFRTQTGSFDMMFGYFPCAAISESGSVRSFNGEISICDYAGGRTYKMYYLEGNIDFTVYDFPDWVTFDVPASYSPDAPYVSFKSLIIDNLLTKGTDDKNVAGHLYTDYFVPSYWQIFYNLENISELDISYKLNLQFEVEIPTLSYVRDLYEDFGYDFTSERSILKRSKELVEYWNKHKNADSRTVTVQYSMDITPNTYGNFNYQFSFLEWEYMLRVSSSELNTEFDSYSVKERSALLAFMHVKKITSEVVTTRADSVVYGGYTTNVFERGVYDSCVDVYTKVDKDFVSSDVLDDLISSDLDAAEDAYKEELENRLDEMQNQIDSMQNFDVAFGGDLESTNVWTSFTSLVKGLASFAPAIAALSSLAGVVLGFLPLQVGAAIASTLLAICVIALIKAIKG